MVHSIFLYACGTAHHVIFSTTALSGSANGCFGYIDMRCNFLSVPRYTTTTPGTFRTGWAIPFCGQTNLSSTGENLVPSSDGTAALQWLDTNARAVLPPADRAGCRHGRTWCGLCAYTLLWCILLFRSLRRGEISWQSRHRTYRW